MPKRICVFTGSSMGVAAGYAEAARDVGQIIAKRGLVLVYGGASVGLMGTLADAALASGGDVIGVIPRSLVDREIAHPGIDDLRIVEGMHQRKALMAELSDAFLALPGGAGTLEELFEVWTWAQLGLHRKPCGLLNVDHYYDALVTFIDHVVDQGFLRRDLRATLMVEPDIEAMLDRFARYEPPAGKWGDDGSPGRATYSR